MRRAISSATYRCRLPITAPSRSGSRVSTFRTNGRQPDADGQLRIARWIITAPIRAAASSARGSTRCGRRAPTPRCTPVTRATSRRHRSSWWASETIAKFANTTAAPEVTTADPPVAERADYFDVGLQQKFPDHLTLGVDSYYRQSKNLIDEGQFGAPIILTPFNYRDGRIEGVEFTAQLRARGVLRLPQPGRTERAGARLSKRRNSTLRRMT